MSHICKFCKNSFVNNCGLLYHQRSAKYCLKIQGIENTKYICTKCGKNLSDIRLLEAHQEKCGLSEKVKQQQDTIVSLEKKIVLLIQKNKAHKQDKKIISNQARQISELQDKLKDIAVQGIKKSTTTNILKLQPLTKEWLDANAKNLTLEHIQRGAIGYAEFASENSFKDRVKCVDASRQILQYKEEDSVIRDRKGRRLAKKFFESIQSQNKELITDAMNKIREEMDGKSNEEIDPLLAKMDEFVDINGIDLVKNEEMKLEFVKELCDLL